MWSKVAALKNSTNVGKRKIEGSGTVVASMKRLKSHSRTMKTEDAQTILKETESKLKSENAIIRNKQKEIRELKKQLKAAEDCVTKAKLAKRALETQKSSATIMATSDVDLILLKVTSNRVTEEISQNAMDDIITLGEDADVLRLASKIRDLAKESPLRGALKSLLAVQQPSSTHVKAFRQLYLPLLECTVKSTDHNTWPIVVSAMAIGTNELQDVDMCAKEYSLLLPAVLKVAELMKKQKPIQCGRYCALKDKCPIIDLLVPTYNAIEHEGGSIMKANLREIIKKTLLESINEVQATLDHSMPTEAAIASKIKFQGKIPNLQQFLLSPTETSLRLDLSKSGRMAVHRLIDNDMGYGKLTHESEGSGCRRCLVIRKVNDEPPEMIKKKQERKQKHMEMYKRDW